MFENLLQSFDKKDLNEQPGGTNANRHPATAHLRERNSKTVCRPFEPKHVLSRHSRAKRQWNKPLPKTPNKAMRACPLLGPVSNCPRSGKNNHYELAKSANSLLHVCFERWFDRIFRVLDLPVEIHPIGCRHPSESFPKENAFGGPV